MARIVFAGYAVRFPMGGYLWQTAHYLLGLRALGHDVVFYEDSGQWGTESAYDPVTNEYGSRYDNSAAAFGAFLERLALGDRWAFVDLTRRRGHGPWGDRTDELLDRADLLISLGAVNRLPIERWTGRPAIFIDSDPVYNQIKLEQGDSALRGFLEAHTHLFTLGENIGTPRSTAPTAGFAWHATRPPVALEHWQHFGAPGTAYTTVGQWHARGRDLSYSGRRLGWSKRTEWLRFLDVPARSRATFELAMDVETVAGDRELLTAHGWRIASPIAVSADPWRYREYIATSRGEFTVAKEMNVRLRSGWFSDRGACYLAAGHPAVEQDTAFGDVLPLGPGLHAFNTPEEAVDAIRAIEADYSRASAHARGVAREHFAAERVVGAMLAVTGL